MGRLVATEEARDYAGLKRTDRDVFVERLISGAEMFVERATGRKFSPDPALVNGVDNAAPVTKTFATRGLESIRIPDLRVATAISLGGITLDPTYGYVLDGRDGEPFYSIEFAELYSFSFLYPAGRRDLSITGRWGFNPTPDDIKMVVNMCVARLYKARDANWADTLQAGPDGAVFTFLRRLPQIAQDVVDYYSIKHQRVALV